MSDYLELVEDGIRKQLIEPAVVAEQIGFAVRITRWPDGRYYVESAHKLRSGGIEDLWVVFEPGPGADSSSFTDLEDARTFYRHALSLSYPNSYLKYPNLIAEPPKEELAAAQGGEA